MLVAFGISSDNHVNDADEQHSLNDNVQGIVGDQTQPPFLVHPGNALDEYNRLVQGRKWSGLMIERMGYEAHSIAQLMDCREQHRADNYLCTQSLYLVVVL